jgi:methyltransferase
MRGAAVKTLSGYLAIIAAVGAERLLELYLSRRNARRAFARGAIESGRRHYRAMVAFHTAFIASCAAEAILLKRPYPGAIAYAGAAGVIGAEVLRYSAVAALGDRWNTRIIVTPGEAPITRGPYRFVRHPNYAAVAIEMIALPIIRGCWLTAAIFSAGNAALMAIRIPAEERALGAAYEAAFSARPRFIPSPRAR